jgi:CRP-like cAMP-binding protein
VSDQLSQVPSVREVLGAVEPALMVLPRRYGVNEAIYHYGDHADGLHLIEAGEVRLEIVHRDGSVVGTDLLIAGDHIGLMDLMTHPPVRHVTARATAITETSFIRIRSISDLLATPMASTAIALDLARRERRTVGRISELTRPRAASRVAAVLLHQFQRSTRVTTTQHVVASLAGVTRQTVSEVIVELLERNVLHRAGRGLRVNDIRALALQADA